MASPSIHFQSYIHSAAVQSRCYPAGRGRSGRHPLTASRPRGDIGGLTTPQGGGLNPGHGFFTPLPTGRVPPRSGFLSDVH